MERQRFIELWAKADTLAFYLFIPIRRKLLENQDIGTFELDAACTAANLAQLMRIELDGMA